MHETRHSAMQNRVYYDHVKGQQLDARRFQWIVPLPLDVHDYDYQYEEAGSCKRCFCFSFNNPKKREEKKRRENEIQAVLAEGDLHQKRFSLALRDAEKELDHASDADTKKMIIESHAEETKPLSKRQKRKQKSEIWV